MNEKSSEPLRLRDSNANDTSEMASEVDGSSSSLVTGVSSSAVGSCEGVLSASTGSFPESFPEAESIPLVLFRTSAVPLAATTTRSAAIAQLSRLVLYAGVSPSMSKAMYVVYSRLLGGSV